MKITGYRSLSTVCNWGQPIGDSNGVVTSGNTEVPILVIETDGGIEGIALGPHPEFERIFPALVGEDPRAVSYLYSKMLRTVFKTGHAGSVYGAIGVADMALWDLKSKMADEPLWRTLGGADRFVPGYASCLEIGVPTENLASVLQPWADRGFRAVKLKGGIDLDRDIERLQLARDVFSQNLKRPALMLDVNESWNCKQAVRHISEIERQVDLTWIEEPVRRWDYQGLHSVSAGIKAGVATGENLTGLEQFRPLFERGSVDIAQTGSCWGITHFLKVATLAQAFEIPISAVGYNGDPMAAASTAVSNHLAIEIQTLNDPEGVSIDREIIDGGIVLGDQIGNGISLDEKAIASAEDASWGIPAGPHVRPKRAGLRLNADLAFADK